MPNRIKELMAERGLTQAQLAELAGVRVATINAIVNDNGNPRLSTIEAIAKALDVRPAEIFWRPEALDQTVAEIMEALKRLDPGEREAILTLIRRRAA